MLQLTLSRCSGYFQIRHEEPFQMVGFKSGLAYLVRVSTKVRKVFGILARQHLQMPTVEWRSLVRVDFPTESSVGHLHQENRWVTRGD